MRALRDLGINTLDLYVPWNWHEVADGDFDFDGRTSPRRDLHEVLRLARALDFHILLRPGPVVRNEWRNGGYPAWLLERPEYGMPAHDILEGRYPATATLQNAHSDDAAAEWMRNATHLRYATRWLQRVLRECAPVADRIVAVALDDDQGAYIDNQTYPAPNLRAYLQRLRDVVRAATAPNVLTFINTYQMKVTASSPVWAMGNWYQSDAYAIGEHDRAQLEFSTGLLHTRPHQPLMASEFQAGWLQGPGENRPRPADPTNTELAITTMLGSGVRGIVNFPAQDTLAPSGWEAPFSNAFYAWDAALGLDGTRRARAVPTARFGNVVRAFGPELAAARPAYDAAIAYLGASYPLAHLTNETYGELTSRTIAAQQACRSAGLSCALVDPQALDARALARYRMLVIPRETKGARGVLQSDVVKKLDAYRAAGGTIVDGIASADALRRAFRTAHLRAAVDGVPGGAFAMDRSGTLDGFLSVPNYGDTPLAIRAGSVQTAHGRVQLPTFVVPAHRAIVAPVGVRLARLAPRFAPDARLAFTDCMAGVAVERDAIVLSFAADAGGTIDACVVAVDARTGSHAITLLPHADASLVLLPNDPLALSTVGDARQPTPVPEPTRTPRFEPALDVVPIRSDALLQSEHPFEATFPGVTAYAADVYGEGRDSIVLDNHLVRIVVSPDAGARAFVFEDDMTGRNIFTSIGALRDDVAIEPPISKTDRIAKYTHQFPAGTFNRPYIARDVRSGPDVATASFAYDAPDVVPGGARFSRTIALRRGARSFDVLARATFPEVATLPLQRAVSVTSIAVGNAGADAKTLHLLVPTDAGFPAETIVHVDRGHAFGFYDDLTGELAVVSWRPGDVEDTALDVRRSAIVTRMRLAPLAAANGGAHLRFGYEFAGSLDAARAIVDAADATAP